MSLGIHPLIVICLLIAAGLLLGIAKLKNEKLKRKGHLLISFVPWFQIILAYAVAFYVRIGFGRWPKSCIDNPDLPMIDVLTTIVLLISIFSVTILPIVWLGWFIILVHEKYKPNLVSSVAFISGFAVLLILHAVDPWKFWEWILD